MSSFLLLPSRCCPPSPFLQCTPQLQPFHSRSSIYMVFPFIDHINHTAAEFFAQLTRPSDLSSMAPTSPAWSILTLPTSLGSLGFHNFSISALSSFTIPLLRFIQYLSKGFKLSPNSPSLFNATNSFLANWS